MTEEYYRKADNLKSEISRLKYGRDRMKDFRIFCGVPCEFEKYLKNYLIEQIDYKILEFQKEFDRL